MDITIKGRENMRYIFKNTQCLSKIYKVLILAPKTSNLNLI